MTNYARVFFRLAAMLLLFIQSITGFAQSDDGITPRSIKLGMSVPLTGPNGAYGEALKEGVLAHFAKINAAGGIGGRNVEVVALDDGYETERTVANTKRLLEQDKVFALLSFYGSSPTTEAMKVFSAARTPLLGTISGADSLRKPVNPYMFNLRASYADETRAIVEHLLSIGIKNVAVFYQNDGFGKSGLDGVTETLKKHGLKPSAVASIERNAVDAAAAVKTIAAANPQAVVMVSLYKPTAAFVSGMKKAGSFPQFVTLSPVGASLLVAELGKENAQGIGISQVMPYPWDNSVPVVRDYQNAIKAAAKHQNFDYYGLEGYVTARVMAEALQRAGRDLTRDKLAKALESAPFELGGYRVSYDPSNHNGSTFVDLTVIGRDGQVLR